MTFDHEFGYSYPLFSSLLKKREEEKENEKQKRDQKSCLSARSFQGQSILYVEAFDIISA